MCHRSLIRDTKWSVTKNRIDMADRPAKQVERWNFSVMFAYNVASTTSHYIVSPSIVLPFLIQTFGAPAIVAALLLPVSQGAHFAAGVLIAPFLREVGAVKWYSFAAWLAIAVALTIVAVFADRFSKIGIVILFVAVAAIIGIGRGIARLGYGQILGATVPVSRRSLLSFGQLAFTGAFVIGSVWLTRHVLADQKPIERHMVILWIGILITVFAGLMIAAVRNLIDDTRGQAAAVAAHRSNGFVGDLKKGIQVAAGLGWYRRFLIARILFLAVELAAPFYIIHAVTFHQNVSRGLSIFVIAVGGGILIGSFVWGWFARRSVKTVMFLTCVVASLAPMMALALDHFDRNHHPAFYGLVIFVVSMSTSGLFQARYLYQVNMATEGDRPYLSAFADVVAVGLGIFLAAGLGALAHLHDATAPLMVLFVLSILASVWVLRLVDVGPTGSEAFHQHPHLQVEHA